MSEYFSGDTKILDKIDTVPNRRGGNRRLHQRFHVNLETILECGNKLYKGIIINISKKGCRVITNDPLDAATKQVILKYIPQGELDTRHVRGRVKWHSKMENRFLYSIELEKPQHV
jgi:hypothetical protein